MRATHRHLKRGTLYQEIGTATLQTDVPLSDMTELSVYVAEDGKLWAREPQHLHDPKRFEQLIPEGDNELTDEELEAVMRRFLPRTKMTNTYRNLLRAVIQKSREKQ